MVYGRGCYLHLRFPLAFEMRVARQRNPILLSGHGPALLCAPDSRPMASSRPRGTPVWTRGRQKLWSRAVEAKDSNHRESSAHSIDLEAVAERLPRHLEKCPPIVLWGIGDLVGVVCKMQGGSESNRTMPLCQELTGVGTLPLGTRVPTGTGATVVTTASRRLTGDGYSTTLAGRQLITARGSAKRSTQDPVMSKR